MAKPKLLSLFEASATNDVTGMIIAYPKLVTNVSVTYDSENKHIICTGNFFIHNSSMLSFIAPCDSLNATHIKISSYAVEGNTSSTLTDELYELVDTNNVNISLLEGMYTTNSIVIISMNTETKKAYITNGAVTPSFINDGYKYTFIWDDEVQAVGIKKLT